MGERSYIVLSPILFYMSLTFEQQQFVHRCINRWAWIRFGAMTPEEQQTHRTTITQVSADVDHSGLLNRLLSGKRPFKYPPPRAMSYPWYSLLEDKQQMSCNAHIHEIAHVNSWLDFPHVNLEQGIWKILRKEDDAYICEWVGGHPWQVRLEQMTEEELQTKPATWRSFEGWRDFSWKVTLLSDVEYMD